MGHRGVFGIPDAGSLCSAELCFQQLRYEQESVGYDDSTLAEDSAPIRQFHLDRVRETMISTTASFLRHS
jgi:hypothetical protein